MTAPNASVLNTTSATQIGGADAPYPQIFDVGAQKFSADVGANAVQLSGSVSPLATSVTLPLGSIASENNIIFDAKSATVAIANGATAQAITDAHLQFYDTIGGQLVTIDYPCAGIGQWSLGFGATITGFTLGSPMSIAQDANQPFFFPINKGLLKNAQLVLTYAVAPTTGTVAAQVTLSTQTITDYVIPPMKAFSISSAGITASANFRVPIDKIFNRGAKMRTVNLVNNGLGVNLSSVYIWGYDTTVIPDAAYMAPSSDAQAASGVNNNNFLAWSDSFYSASAINQTNEMKRMADVVDSLMLQITNTTAAIGGSLDCWVSQAIG